MSILDDLANPPKRMVPFTEWLIAQPADVRAELDKAALNRIAWTDSSLEKLLRRYGASCSIDSVRAWRADVASR